MPEHTLGNTGLDKVQTDVQPLWHYGVVLEIFAVAPYHSAMPALSSSYYAQCPGNSPGKSLGLRIKTLGFYFGSTNSKCRANHNLCDLSVLTCQMKGLDNLIAKLPFGSHI